MNVPARSRRHPFRRDQNRVAATLTLALLLSACAAPVLRPDQPAGQLADQSTRHVVDQTANALNGEPAPGRVSSAVCNLQESAAWYNQYHALVPDDLLGLKRLTGVCTALEEAGLEDENCRQAALRVSGALSQVEPETWHLQSETSPAVVLQEGLRPHIDDRCIVAELLGIPLETVELGPNLVDNGGFEEWHRATPVRWRWLNMMNREPWSSGLAVGGRDSLSTCEGESATRVEGLWVQNDGAEPARAGYGYRESQVNLEPGHFYIVTLLYRTRSSKGQAGIWFSQDSRAIFAGERLLPATDGVWRGYVVLGRSSDPAVLPIWPLLRNWGEGTVWFDEQRVREIEFSHDGEWTE